MTEVPTTGLPSRCLSAAHALGAATNMAPDQVVILAFNEAEGFVLLSGGVEGMLGYAEILFMLRRGEHTLMHDFYEDET